MKAAKFNRVVSLLLLAMSGWALTDPHRIGFGIFGLAWIALGIVTGQFSYAAAK